MVVQRAPACADERGHEEQKGTPRLVEVGDKSVGNVEGVAGGYDERGGGFESVDA